MSRKPRRSERTRKRSLRLRSGRLYCLDRRSASAACHGNSTAAATRLADCEHRERSANQSNKWKTFHHIRLYRWKDFPLIMILNHKTWKKALLFSTYYNLLCQIPLIAILKGVNMENMPKFRPNPNLKLMAQVRDDLGHYRYT